MNIDKTRNLLDIQAIGDRRAALLETAAVLLEVLDGLLNDVLEQAGEIEVEAPVGMSETRCLKYLAHYHGLHFRRKIADTTEQV